MARIDANPSRAAICLTGGSSPKQLYRLLATDSYRSRIPWDRIHWFIGDERFVAPNDPRNNMAMARETFLDRSAPAANIHPIPTDGINPDEAARLLGDPLPGRAPGRLLVVGRDPDDGRGACGHETSITPTSGPSFPAPRHAIAVA